MINEVVLVGKIKNIGEISKFKKEILLEVERAYQDVGGNIIDVFKCELWNAIFNKIINYCNIGDLVAIKGRLASDNDEFRVVAENVVLVNKSKDNILKDK